jgi:hypothetical protein
VRLVYGGGRVGVGWGYEISCVLIREGDVGAWVLLCRPKLGRHNNTHAPTSPSLLNTHEISYLHPTPTPTPLHHTQDACQNIAAYKFVVNLST